MNCYQPVREEGANTTPSEVIDNVKKFDALVVAEYHICVRNAMLHRIMMFGGTAIFQTIAAELAQAIDIDVEESTQLLWPTAHAIYQAAANHNMPEPARD